MAETKRTLTDIVTNLIQDGQAANAISEQDHRDIVASMQAPFGSASMTANAVETTIVTVDVFAAIAGTFVEGDMLTEVTVNAAGGVLTYTGTPDRHFHIVSNVSFIAASNNKIVLFQWFKNGTTALPAPIERKVGTGADIGSMSVHADVMMSTGDTLELKIANSTDDTNFTVENIYTFVQGMFV